MNVVFKPELEKYIRDQLRAGRFESAEAVVQEALQRMMRDESDDIDQETAEAIARAEKQLDNGQGMEFEKFSAVARRKYIPR